MPPQQQSAVGGPAATLPSSPAFSFGTRPGCSSCSGSAGPGPCAPPPLACSSEHQRVRACGFGTASRSSLCATGGAAAPAPGEYSCGVRATHRRAASATMPGRPQPGRAAQQPGPGHYSTRTAATRPAAPAVSISHRLPDSKETERHPGPGEYDAAAYHAKSPLPVTIKHRRPASALDRPDSGHAVPGPGAYIAKDASLSTRSSSPVHTMAGGRPASCSSTMQQQPGPADYSPYADRSRIKAGAGWGFGAAEKQPGSRYEVRPGPGSYFTHSVAQHPAGHSLESTRGSARAAAIGYRQPAAAPQTSPGPGDYYARDALGRRSSPCFTFKGVDAKDPLAANPAPNAYNPARSMGAVRVAAPAVSIGQRHAPPGETQRRPGSGEYDVAAAGSSGKSSGVSLKFRHTRQLDNGATVAPGPGEYVVDARAGTISGRRSPHFSMGMRLPPQR